MWLVQVAVKPYLLYENSYEATPDHVPKDPTVSQVPTEIGGAVAMTIMNAGKTAIQVSAPHWKPGISKSCANMLSKTAPLTNVLCALLPMKKEHALDALGIAKAGRYASIEMRTR